MSGFNVFAQAKQEEKERFPLQGILTAVMRGNAMVQGQEQAKSVASDQMDANVKTTVTLKANPNGGEPIVTVKDAPASLLNGTQQQDVTDAHDKPRLAVEAKLAPASAPAQDQSPAAPVYDAIDKTLGYHVPRPSDPDIAEKLKTPEGIRALTIEMGGKAKDAEPAIRALKEGRITTDYMRDHVAAHRTAKLNAIYAQIKAPLDEAQDITERGGKGREESRKASDDDLKHFYDFAKPENLRTFLDNGSMVSAATDAGFTMTPRREKQLSNAREEAYLADLKKDKAALGTYAGFDDLKAALGVNLSPTREAELHADYNAARNNYVTASKRAQRQLDIQAEELQLKRNAVKNMVTKQDQAKDIAAAIVSGKQPPEFKSMYGLTGAVRAELAKSGYDLERASLDWQASQQHVRTLNGPQQTRLRQSVDAAYSQLDVVEGLYSELRKELPASGIKVFNRASLATAKHLPGKAGASAQALEGQIALLTGELGNTLMGGNSPTDHALSLAQSMLSGDWNEETFKKAVQQLRVDLGIRKNSLANSQPAGMSVNQTLPVITDEKTILDLFGAKQ